MNFKSHLAGASLICLASAAQAQQASSPDTTPVSPLVITATKIATPLDQVASSITLITADQIADHQWRTLPDALQDVPGINVVQTGGPGGLTSVFIRGANSNQTKVIIDGIEVNDPSQNDAFDFGQVLTADLDKVEVLRGPQGSLYGADALGGVINIVTRQGDGPPRLTGSLEGGSFDTFNQTVGVAGSDGAFHFAADLAHFHAGATPVTPLGLLPPGEARIDDYYNNLTLSSRLGWDVTKDVSLGFVVRYVDAELRNTGENYNDYPAIPDSAQTVQDTSQLFLRGEANFGLFDGKLKNTLGVGFADYHTTIQAPDDGFGASETIDDADRVNIDWQGTLALSPRNTLVMGVGEDIQQILNTSPDERQAIFGAFAEIQSRPIDPLTVAANVRIDDDDHYGDYATWRIAPVLTVPGLGTLIKGSVGTGFKSPTLTQLYVSYPPYFFANPNLQPETSLGYDIGFEQPLAKNVVRLGATWFHENIDNLITTSADGMSWANIGKATTYGIESFVSVTLPKRLTVTANYTWTVARDDILAEELLRRPEDRASLSGTWRPIPRLVLAATWLYVGAWVDGNRDFSIPRLTASPYGVVNISGAYDLGHGVTAFARIDNLLDRQYQDPVGFDKPGIGAYGGLRLSLGGK
jgi:vitamin B12 transporter